MNLLALDTSTARASIALQFNDVQYQAHTDEVAEHARGILPLIEQVLHRANAAIAELHGVVFGRGPGSFTGLRIASGVAKGLAYAHDLPLYPVSGLAAIAYGVQSTSAHPVLAVLDARMNQLYWAFYQSTDYNAIESVSDAADIVIAGDQPFILAGVGFEAYRSQMPTALNKRILTVKTHYPAASDLIALVNQGTIPSVSAAAAQPIYIRNQVTQGAK